MDLKRITREWAKARAVREPLVRLPGTSMHLRAETVAAILQESQKSKRPVGEIVREDYIELAAWVRAQAELDDDLAAALGRFFSTGGAGPAR